MAKVLQATFKFSLRRKILLKKYDKKDKIHDIPLTDTVEQNYIYLLSPVIHLFIKCNLLAAQFSVTFYSHHFIMKIQAHGFDI